MADQLVTLAQVKARSEVIDAADDALLTELIEQVSDSVQDVTGRRFIAENGATYVFDTARGGVIHVPRGVRAVTAIGLASSNQPDVAGTYTAVAAGQWALRPLPIDRRPGWPATRILIRATAGSSVGALSDAIAGATVTGDFGFAAVPPQIQAIVLDAVVAAFGARTGASEVIGEGTALESWAQFFGADSSQVRTLARFRAGYAIGIG